MIKAVFFDLYGTLAGFSPPREKVQNQACQHFGFTVSREGLVWGYAAADAFMAQVNAGPHPMSRHTPEERAAFFAEYERLILQGAGVAVNQETAGRVWERVQQIPYGLALFDDALPALDDLRGRELTLGMVSNMGRDMQKLSDRLGLTPYLDFAIASREVGAEKPHPPIFHAALRRAGVQPQEAIHVGDQYLSDVQGARGVGITPLLIDREGVLAEVTDCPKIASLMEISDYL